jgi:glycosyltransferase involved in cell wall biosynthesis
LLIGPAGSGAGEMHVRPEFVARVHEKIAAAGLRGRVVLLGHRLNVDGYRRAATRFVFTSRSEGFGTALIEAMASGLACVALEIPNVTGDIITSGRDGVVIREESPSEFAEVIDRLLRDPSQASSLERAARPTVLKRFALKGVTGRYA